jgi:methionine-rich copper-binding protein CopC
MKASLATAATALLLALGPAGAAAAQTAQQGPWQQVAPEYESSEPAEGAMLHEPPTQVKITFSEPLDSSSTMMVHDECGRQIDNGNVQVVGTDMTVGIAKTPAGSYTVMYSAVGFGGITGTTDDEFSFMVHSGPACDGSGSSHHHGGHSGSHEGHGEHQGHGQHSGHDMGDMDHSGGHSAHDGGSGMDHMDMGHMDMDHMDMGHMDMGHSDRSGGHRGGHARKQHHQDSSVADGDTFAADPLTPVPLEPNSQAVLSALLMSLGLGVLGGWYLRTSARR